MAQVGQFNPSCIGGSTSGDFEIGVVLTSSEPYTIVMTDMTTGAELAGSRRTISSTGGPSRYGCKYWAHYDSTAASAAGRVQFLPDRLYRIDMFPEDPTSALPRASYYDFHALRCAAGSGVFCSSGPLGSDPDVVFFIREEDIGAYPVQLGSLGVGASVEEVFATAGDGNAWTMPYDVTRFCALSASRCLGTDHQDGAPLRTKLMFLSRIPFGSGPATLPVPLRAADGADWRVPSNQSYTWSSADVSQIRFGAGGKLTVSGYLSATGTTFTAADPAQGWRGVNVSGGTLTLGTGSLVKDVVTTTGAVTVSGGGTATLDGARIRDTRGGAGLLVSGSSTVSNTSSLMSARTSSARITGASLLNNNASGPGVRATAGAQVTIDADGVQIYGNSEGIAATGTGSSVLILGGFVRNNAGPGLRASSGGRINVLRDTGGSGNSSFAATALPVRVWNNIGGLYATSTGKQGGGVVWSGDYVCVQAPCPSTGGHDFRTNTNAPPGGGPVYDALATGGSRVTAPHNYWDGRTSAQVDSTSLADKSSSIDVSDALLAPPASGGSASGRGVAARTAPTRSGGASPAAQRLGTGRVDAAVQALLSEADGLVQTGDSTLAATRIVQAYAVVTSDDDRLAVAEAAGRTLAVVQPPVLIAWAEALTATPVGRPWGRRALAAGHAGQGRTAEALAVAQALASEDGAGADSTAEAHRARGLGLVVETAVALGDAALAVQTLSDLASVDPDGADELALSVALAFPDAPVSYGRGVVASRGTAPTDASAKAETESAALVLGVSPNPSAGAVHVAVTLGTASEARVEVFDALGRRVALLHDGPGSGTLAATFDGAGVPAGVYVVRAVVRSADGSVSVVVRRVTVAR